MQRRLLSMSTKGLRYQVMGLIEKFTKFSK